MPDKPASSEKLIPVPLSDLYSITQYMIQNCWSRIQSAEQYERIAELVDISARCIEEVDPKSVLARGLHLDALRIRERKENE